jgi:hypothetical protein
VGKFAFGLGVSVGAGVNVGSSVEAAGGVDVEHPTSRLSKITNARAILLFGRFTFNSCKQVESILQNSVHNFRTDL